MSTDCDQNPAIYTATAKDVFPTVLVTSSGKQKQIFVFFVLPSPKSLIRFQWRLESMFYSLTNMMVILGRHYHLNESDFKEVFGLIVNAHGKQLAC